MAQILKQELYDRLLDAAEAVFAELGFAGASMARIAERAGVSTGNIYRYFDSKEALYEAVVSDEFRRTFFHLLRRRLSSLLESPQPTALNDDARQRADDLLRYWIQHRRKVVILLDRAEGSRDADVGRAFVDELVAQTSKKLCLQSNRRSLCATDQLVLQLIFQNTRRSLVAILERFSDESEIREAVAAFWSYQLAGLAGFAKKVES